MLFYALILVLLAPVLVGIYMGYRLLHPHRVSPEEAYKSQLANGEISKEFEVREKKSFTLQSEFGYRLSGFYFPGSVRKTIIFSHGISWNKLGSAKYLGQFFEGNWNIFLYDHRGAGESGGKYPSFGFYEKYDLKKVKEFASNLYPDTEIWGLFGESMGGATVLQYAPLDPSISFIVAVCPFADLKDLMRYHLKKYNFPDFISSYIFYFANLYLKIIGKFDANNVSPIKDISTTPTPLFISHGTDDKVVPYYMGENLKNCRKNTDTTVFLEAKGSGHTPFLYLEHKDEFEKTLEFFLKTYAKT